MLKAAVARTPILALILMFMAVGYTIAHNKVVVVSLGSTEPTLDIYYGSITTLGTVETGNIPEASRLTTGRYTVELGRSFAGCAATVSRGRQGNSGGNIIIAGESIVDVIPNSNSIRVIHYAPNLETVNTDFHLIIICPKV